MGTSRGIGAAFISSTLACAAPQVMNVDSHLAHDAELHYVVASETEPEKTALDFGPYSIHRIQQEPIATVTSGKIVSRRHRWAFWLSAASNGDWHTRCESTTKAERNGQTGAIALSCTMASFTTEDERTWTLEISGDAAGARIRAGELEGSRGERLRVQSSHDPARGQLGFEIYLSDRPVAAVQTVGTRALWLDPGLRKEIRSAIAASAGGLMLFDHLTADRW